MSGGIITTVNGVLVLIIVGVAYLGFSNSQLEPVSPYNQVVEETIQEITLNDATIPNQSELIEDPLMDQAVIEEQPGSLVLRMALTRSGYERIVAYGKLVEVNHEKKNVVIENNDLVEAFPFEQDPYVCRIAQAESEVSCTEALMSDLETGQFVELSLIEDFVQAENKIVQRIVIPS